MNNKRNIFVLCVTVSLCLLCQCAFAANNEIKLKDGTTIKGEVVSKEGQFYKIASEILGMLVIKESDIVSISAIIPKPQPITKTPAEQNEEIIRQYRQAVSEYPSQEDKDAAKRLWQQSDSIQQKIFNDPKVLESIKNLSEEKDVIDLLNDPRMQEAIKNMDLEYLKNNEGFIKVMNNPAMQKIMQSVTGKNTEQSPAGDSLGKEKDGREN